ncbi:MULTISPECIES: RNA polymerase sigma factor [Nostocales]|uniref:RNA polymerase sigma factor n=1 Tax=Nostocales TaxID=1161 RepID=UPI001689A9C3|nr:MULTISPECIES: RNA polymerase sigma factor [Nostocales]MBD2302049.1 RNA polymerase sigma factor [Nostoc sp. FACHB-190]MBD2490798.1 RNA polymerase sigma factor [Aulosira sp. FACHB-615]
MINSQSCIQANPEQEILLSLSEQKIRSILPQQIQVKVLSQDNGDEFWQIWLSSQDYFYKCCLKWMGGNSYDAEDTLNQAMLKAQNQWKKYAGKITSPKVWLTQIIYNFCMDVHRKRKREALEIENIDEIKFADHPAFFCEVGFPESNILALEMRAYLRHKIESLPDRLRHPFILHCCQEKSYQDIAQLLALSQENVRKRIQQARKILQKQLKNYLAGEDKTSFDSLSPSLQKGISMVEESQPDKTVICHCKSSIATKSKQEEINYKVTVICLETLSHPWYSSPNSLGWN